MGETSDRIEGALAAYLDYLEMGGPEPDTGHLTRSEQEELKKLIAALETTEGVAFGLGRREEIRLGESSLPPAPLRPPAQRERPEQSELLLSQLRDALPSDVRIESDTIALVSQVGGVEILDGWIVGTFGGRVRVWLLDVDAAQEVEGNRDCLTDLDRVFRMLSDTTAIALVARDLSCLMVQPEDTAPQIHVPSGSLVGRRYRRSIQPIAEAVRAFLGELIPYWDPAPAFDPPAGLSIDVSAVSEEFVTTAVETQRGFGRRARKGNPKKDALLELGSKEIAALTGLARGLFDGSVEPEEVEEQIEKLAKSR
jgi:hypothetical protein